MNENMDNTPEKSDQKENIPKDLQDNLSKNVAEDLKEREDLRQYTKRIVIRRILLKAHIIGFLFINFMLFMINNLSGNFSFTNYQWWPWVFTGWGVPIAFHMFFYYHKNPLTPYTVHRFTFITISIYMVFIDLYSDYSLSWSWIPILCWGGLFLIHRLAKQDSKKHEVEVTIYGLIISDQSGRVLVDVVLDKETIKEKLNLEEEGLEMVGMFINAIQSFSYEVNLAESFEDEMDLHGKHLRMHSIKQNELTLTGFVSPQTKTSHMKPLLKKILRDFTKKYEKEIKIFKSTGNCQIFSDYKKNLNNQIHNLEPVVTW